MLPHESDTAARRTLLTVSVAAAITTMDITIVNVALAAIAADLSATLPQLQWMVNAYPLLFAALLLVGGSVSDRLGRRRIFVAGVVLFTIGSLLCGVAPAPGVLIAGRAVQGIGGALIFAPALPLLAAAYPGQRRNAAMGVFSATAAVSAAIAPLVGGALVSSLGWRSIFLVNLLPGAFVLFGALRWLPASGRQAGRRLDLAGAVLGVLLLGTVNLAVISGADEGWTRPVTLVAAGVAVVALVLFVATEHRTADPMLQLALFRIRAFTGVSVLSFLTRAVGFGTMPYLVLWLQGMLGYSPLQAGLQLSALSVAIVGGSLVVARLQHRYGTRAVVVAGFVAICGGYLLVARVGAESTWLVVLPGLLLIGAGMGLLFAPLMGISVSVVPPQQAGMASGTANAFFPLGTAVGAAVFGAVLAGRVGSGLSDDAVRSVGVSGQTATEVRELASAGRFTDLPPEVAMLARVAFVDGLATVAWVAAGAAAVGVAVALATVPSGRDRPAVAAGRASTNADVRAPDGGD
ncbi:EmrB/QacA subfamily drug resistance transporter [Micromonospora sp. Llam0]|uniref:MFS transporter n=1 Tax=Micromonospora sp. Llam0 TaxID=2485143 RepID=UPI000F49818C|nr:MFS transporter [Micromonospora sp. Llam0]ROO59772.1 EmrB/QacA subfamily drug resistance transporter [Micromonospora sp. Llam0]